MLPSFDTNSGKEKKTFEKTRFLATTLGEHTVRILNFKGTYVHYIPFSKTSVACLGEECPICMNNKRIIIENPDDFRDIKGWMSRQKRHLMNVLDRTLVKVCPNCGEETSRGISGQFPASCWKCDNILPQDLPITPSNKVKVLSLSDTNAERLNAKQHSNLDKDGNPIPFTQCDIVITATMISGKKDISVSTTKDVDVVTVPEEFWYDLDKVTIKLTASEINDHLRGVSLKDIFAARRGAVETSAEEKLEETTVKEIQNKIDELLGEVS